MYKKSLVVGVQYSHVPVLQVKIEEMVENEIDYICSNILPSDVVESSAISGIPIPFKQYWPHSMLPEREWASVVVGVLPNMDKYLEDPKTLYVQRATAVINRQLEYCHYLGLPAVMLEITQESNKLAEIIQARTNKNNTLRQDTFWAKVNVGCGVDGSSDPPSWLWFNKFRRLCGGDIKLRPVLKLNTNLPDDESELNPWLGEIPVAICLNLNAFLTNERGHPVLPRTHQRAVRKLFVHDVHIILEVSDRDHSVDLQPYRNYLLYLHKCYLETPSNHPLSHHSDGYENVLLPPLQPLMDNLASSTYADFELDPFKYRLYEDAVHAALKKLALGQAHDTNEPLIIVVAGAGRGPLVTVSRKVAEALQIKVRIYALEKNPNASITLLNLNKSLWENQITVVCTDMRCWEPPEKADLIVSELLGSFGDNELSPECLNGAQRFLKRTGIIIPEEYSSYIGPIMSHELCTKLTKFHDSKNQNVQNVHLEAPYVAYMTKKYDIAIPKKLFKFTHPISKFLLKEGTIDRYKRLEFQVLHDCECHGFSGYFDSVLFENVTMSIHPDTHSPGLFSWFSMYFPIRAAISLKKGDKLVVGFWRRSNACKVWYEWTVISPQTLPIHNLNGRYSFFGL